MSEQKKVIVIGAGNAGLSAAYELEKAGVPYELLEATDRFGGRLRYRVKDDLYFSDGPVFTEPQWETTFGYVREFGLEDRVADFPVRKYGLYRGDEQIDYFLDKGNLFGALLQVKNLPKDLVIQGAKFLPAFAKATKLVGNNYDFHKLAEVSRMSIKEWCDAHGVPMVCDMLLGPMIRSMTLGRSQDVSIAHPITLLRMMEGMNAIAGGLKTINECIYDHGVKDHIVFNAPVSRVVVEDGEVKGVKMASGEFKEADEVILCTDAYDAHKLVPNAPEPMAAAWDSCTYSNGYHYLWYYPGHIVPEGLMMLFIPESFDSHLCTVGGAPTSPLDRWPGWEGDPIHDFNGNAELVSGFAVHWHEDYFNTLTDDERNEVITKEVDKFFPGFSEKAELVAADYITRGINLEPPGQFELMEELKSNHMDDVKGLTLAGEYLFLIACTEGAWMTGKQAGEKVVDKLQA